jgi:DNA polymerase-3 subunit epsilon
MGDGMKTDKIKAIKLARKIIGQKPVYLDTETTGLGNEAEIVDLAVIDYDGTELINTLIKPMVEIPAAATRIHGIVNGDVVDAPYLDSIDFQPYQKRVVVIYNADYDLRVISQSARAKGSAFAPENFTCAMKLYAQFYGDWNDWHKSYRWQSQANAAKQLGIEIPPDLHRAAADANLCRLIVEAMAASPLPDETTQSNRFIESFNALATCTHETAKAKGFWDKPREDAVLIALMASELFEAFEAVRHGNPPDDKIPEFSGYEAELADCIIRIMDAAAARGLRVAEAVLAKMAYNEGRPHKHGKEF